jgi:hypothetical protein
LQAEKANRKTVANAKGTTRGYFDGRDKKGSLTIFARLDFGKFTAVRFTSHYSACRTALAHGGLTGMYLGNTALSLVT